MHEYQRSVREFHQKFGLTINEVPTIPNDKDVALRVNLIMEETGELFEAAAKTRTRAGVTDCTVGMADAGADLLYVIYGAGLTYGMELTCEEAKIPLFELTKSSFLVDVDLKELPKLTRRGMEACRKFAEASIKKDLGLIQQALSNLLEFTHAAVCACGIDIDPVFQEVQRSNMSKLWPGGEVRRRPEDGKIMKPPTYSPADIKGVLAKQ